MDVHIIVGVYLRPNCFNFLMSVKGKLNTNETHKEALGEFFSSVDVELSIADNDRMGRLMMD